MKEARVILNRLLDKYENSKHLFQPGISARRVMLRIDRKELPEYDYQDPSVRDAYNAAAVELERQSLVRLEWSRENLVLSIITLNLEPIMECYGQAGRVHPRVEAERFSAWWRSGWQEFPCHGSRRGGTRCAQRRGNAGRSRPFVRKAVRCFRICWKRSAGTRNCPTA